MHWWYTPPDIEPEGESDEDFDLDPDDDYDYRSAWDYMDAIDATYLKIERGCNLSQIHKL